MKSSGHQGALTEARKWEGWMKWTLWPVFCLFDAGTWLESWCSGLTSHLSIHHCSHTSNSKQFLLWLVNALSEQSTHPNNIYFMSTRSKKSARLWVFIEWHMYSESEGGSSSNITFDSGPTKICKVGVFKVFLCNESGSQRQSHWNQWDSLLKATSNGRKWYFTKVIW